MSALGRHVLVEFFGCSSEILNEVSTIEKAMIQAAEDAEATIINSTFHHFSPYGVSGVVVIQESHLAIHTWPEFQYAAVDIFTCGDIINPWVAYDALKAAFEAKQGSSIELRRGQTDLLERVDFNLNQDRATKEAELKPTYKREVWFTDRDDNIALSIRHKGELLYNETSAYQKVRVYDTYEFGKMLAIDNIVMCTEKDEHNYHEMLIHVPMQSHPNPKNILLIGAGDGGSARELIRYESVEKITQVEIDEKVVEASKLHFPDLSSAYGHPKLELIINDGIKFVANSSSEVYDLVIIDGSDPQGPAEGLFSTEFFKNVHRVLRPGGVLCFQSESPHCNGKAFIELNQCQKDIFGKEKVHTYLAYIPMYPSGVWSFMYASKGEAHPLNINDSTTNTFARKHRLRYYTADIHRAAFALPTYVKEMIGERE